MCRETHNNQHASLLAMIVIIVFSYREFTLDSAKHSCEAVHTAKPDGLAVAHLVYSIIEGEKNV